MYRAAGRQIRRYLYRGSRVTCNVCERSFSGWTGSGDSCPYCNSQTRHKFLVQLLNGFTHSNKQIDVLYFAPDWGVERWLRKRRDTFKVTTVDLGAPGVDVSGDITNLPFDNASFDLVLCSHVLEHVPHDIKAMKELYRILRLDCVLLVQVPYRRNAAETFEDFSITNPLERKRLFGQFDHCRIYGRDLNDRLSQVGFSITHLYAENAFDEKTFLKLALWNDIAFWCVRAHAELEVDN
jgi:SAM-dependent methyltransferase